MLAGSELTKLGKGPFKYYVRKEVSRVRKWQFLLIYSTIYADVGGSVGLKSQKHADVILEWSLIIINLIRKKTVSGVKIEQRCRS